MLMACNNDQLKHEKDPDSGEKSVVKLTIYDATTKVTRSTSDEEPAVGAESTIDPAKGLNVLVFDADDGMLVYPYGAEPVNLSLTELAPSGSGIYETTPFTITSGQKYFYVFANDDGTSLPNPIPDVRSQFIAKTISASLNATDVLNLTDPDFRLGTLWSQMTIAPGGGTTLAPAVIRLNIGRLASKVILKGVAQGSPSTMAGTFSDPEYRLGSIPKSIFLVGNNDESAPVPPLLGHGVVTSAVHTAPIPPDAGDGNFQRYTNTWKDMDEPYYTVENTSQPDNNNIQYYGNTSYIQIRTVYTPDGTEVHKVDDLSVVGSFTGPTFYTARLISNGARLIFEQDPRTAAGLNPNADIDQQTVEVYTDGLNYHKFPIHDPEAGLPEVQRNAVLRNHYYEYTVTSIADIGTPGEQVDPKEPIETKTTLKIEVKVLPWSKITNNNIPI